MYSYHPLRITICTQQITKTYSSRLFLLSTTSNGQHEDWAISRFKWKLEATYSEATQQKHNKSNCWIVELYCCCLWKIWLACKEDSDKIWLRSKKIGMNWFLSNHDWIAQLNAHMMREQLLSKCLQPKKETVLYTTRTLLLLWTNSIKIDPTNGGRSNECMPIVRFSTDKKREWIHCRSQ